MFISLVLSFLFEIRPDPSVTPAHLSISQSLPGVRTPRGWSQRVYLHSTAVVARRRSLTRIAPANAHAALGRSGSRRPNACYGNASRHSRPRPCDAASRQLRPNPGAIIRKTALAER